MKILFWNVRGLNDRRKCRSVRSTIHGAKPDMVCLQEMKLETVNSVVCLSVGGRYLNEFAFKKSVVAASGLLTMWNGSEFICTNQVLLLLVYLWSCVIGLMI